MRTTPETVRANATIPERAVVRRILVDCTQTTAVARHAGIPRVVRNIARHGAAAAALHGATLVPMRYDLDRFVHVGLSGTGELVVPKAPDPSWTSRYWPAVDAAIAAGARMGVVQYDFIPHTHPELMPRKLPTAFRDWMTETLARADFVAAISESVAGEAREELRKMGRDPGNDAPLVRAFLAEPAA